jgi:integrase
VSKPTVPRKGEPGIRHVKVNGRWCWQARVAHGGRRKSRLCETFEAARQAKHELIDELAGDVQDDAPATLRQLLEFYGLEMESRGKGAESVARVDYTRRSIEAVTPALLDKPVSAIVHEDLFAFRNARRRFSARATELRRQAVRLHHAGRKKDAERLELAAAEEDRKGTRPSTINRDLRTLRAALKAARPEYRFPRGAFFPEDETRVRWLRPEEELLVLEPMSSPFREMAKLAALTLMRMTEIRTLRPEYVHLEQGVVMLPRAKAGARSVVLSEAAQSILREQLKASTGAEWLFPGPGDRPYSREQIGKMFRAAVRGAGLKDFRFHDLRHHGATMALNRGFTAPIVMALGGWKTERMMRRYAAVTDATLRAAAEAVSGAEPRPWPALATGHKATETAASVATPMATNGETARQ